MKLQLVAPAATFIASDESTVAFAVLLSTPLLAGLLLLFLLFAVSHLLELRELDSPPEREIATYKDLARLAATGILFSLSATIASLGWISNWWGGLEVVITLFIASIVAVAVLAAQALKRAGAI